MMLSLHASGTTNLQQHFPQLRGKLFDKNFRLANGVGEAFLTHTLMSLDKTERSLKDSPFDEEALLMKAML